jgi:hypothetical protein
MSGPKLAEKYGVGSIRTIYLILRKNRASANLVGQVAVHVGHYEVTELDRHNDAAIQ